MYPQVIYINGPTSAGKTTLARAIQVALTQPYLHIGIDTFIAMMPSNINDWTGGNSADGFCWQHAYDHLGVTIQKIAAGPYAEEVCRLYQSTLLFMLGQGARLIIDDVAFLLPVSAWRLALSPYETLFVGLRCSLDVLEERERARSDRIRGSARAQLPQVHQGASYDIEVDTSVLSVEQAVAAILEKTDGARSRRDSP